ncbi:MAG TPA: response regulator transcription factor [Rhizomicrobium sp.]|nr:response regulator transcription factor [Rhizomicrobium sp.]
MHILLVDDDPALSELLTEYLAGEGIKTTAAFNGPDGAAQALSGQYDAVILDVMLPGMDGNEVLRRIRQSSSVPVIMLTAKGGDVDRVVGLEMGADDYVAKPYFPRELVARLRAVLRRQREAQPQPSQSLKSGTLELSPGKREVTWKDAAFELTTTEFDMLESLMRGGEMVSSKEELSLKVLGRPREIYDRSVDVHVSNLRKKLALASDGALEIETIRGVGYRLRLA